jgi:SagB-type dehydrogenase family enzyme
MTWREYHESTKHSAESLRRTQHFLDWANMPNPFRHYEGAPLLDLPADPPSPEIPALEVLQGGSGSTRAANGAAFLSQLLFYAASISASKRVPSTGYTYALRVNPSSGNLHPTEFHFITRGLADWPDGLYHYRPSSHMAEQRALGIFELAGGSAPIVFILTSIAWREAWKYRDRAYRYCLHDMGHAWQALVQIARAMGCVSFATGGFPDDDVARVCRLHEDEWPMLVVRLQGESIPGSGQTASETIWSGGRANLLSGETIVYPLIEGIHAATKFLSDSRKISHDHAATAPIAGRDEIQLPPPVSSNIAFGAIARMRRSALDFTGGAASMSQAQLAAVLDAAARPLAADFASTRFVQLYLYAHRVEGLAPGVYRHWPESSALERIKAGDQRVAAAGLSLGQDLAGNACVAFSMIADIERAACVHGDRGYRYVHFEAGAIGQRLYIAAEALGLRATGIGAFFDDEVNRYLDLGPGQQVVYHFAIGYPVTDSRLEA